MLQLRAGAQRAAPVAEGVLWGRVSGRAGRARGAGAVATSMRSVERSVSTTAHSQSAIVTTSTSGPVVRSAAVHGPRWTGAVRGHSLTEQGALSSRGVSTSARVNGVRADVSGRGNRQVCHSHTRRSTSTAAAAAAAGAGRIGAHCGPAMPGVRVGRQHGGHGYRHREFHSTSALLSDKKGDDDGAVSGQGDAAEDGDDEGGKKVGEEKKKRSRKNQKVKVAPSKVDKTDGGSSAMGDDGDDDDDDDDDDDESRRRMHNLILGDDSEHATVTALLAKPPIPDTYPEVVVVPVDRVPLFPMATQLITVSDPVLIKRLKRVAKTDPWIGVFLRKEARTSSDDFEESTELAKEMSEVHPIGSFCRILSMDSAEDFSNGKPVLRMLAFGIRRIEASGTVEDASLLTAEVDNLKDLDYETKDVRIQATIQELMKTLQDIMNINQLWQLNVKKAMHFTAFKLDDPIQMSFFILSLLSGSVDGPILQSLLEETDVEKRLPQVLELLKKEHLQAKLQQQIADEVEKQVTDRNRQAMLYEQLKVIKKELGITKDDKDAVSEKFQKRIEDLTVPDEVAGVIEEEMNKLNFLDPNSSEFNVTRNYLDWLTTLPWGKTTEENLDIENAQTVLDEDHYGMKDAKDRILEFIAVGKLRGAVQGKILLLVGPPGVGKTSIGKSIARALNRKYYRFSVGGLHDVAEIKGHRRTYVGAMPGKAIQCLKKCESENPLVLIDEVDKIGRAHNGDPTSALLELLDPEQNNSFTDHYLDVPVDLSKVLFLCTANTTDSIPGPLLDRMEVIELSGYMASEKQEIAREYIIPHEFEEAGVKADQVTLDDDAVAKLIQEYCRESGVRGLQKQIEKLLRKAALKIVRGGEDKVQVTMDNLKEFVGNPLFRSERMYDQTPTGVIMGLAWTAMGGQSLYIETVAVPPSDAEKPSAGLAITGQLGDVMKESTQIAYTYSKGFLMKRDPNNSFFRNTSIGLHVPEGAIPKDGPSAGVTMTSALLSLALDRPVRQDLAMTGEISLTGKVLRVGGIKEKMLAARRSGVTCVVLPDGNEADFEDLPKEVKDGLEVHFAATYDDVFKVAFAS
eukprot:m.99387 g.99387  ORF g.99387 m.99387 type:complete len:1079 (+) comp20619_c0_seq1:40-3276(+)